MRFWMTSGLRLWSSSWVLASMLLILGCQVSSKHGETNSGENAPLVDEKYSLTADRKELEELRKNIPAEKKKENDELALLNQFFADPKKSPSEIRSKFDDLLRKKRELFQKDMTRDRENYVKEEKKRRDDFNKEQEDQKKEFGRKKVDREERSEFYNDLDGKRKDFYSNERSKRDDFEENMRDKRKNFDDYAREKSNEFNQELRAFTQRRDQK